MNIPQDIKETLLDGLTAARDRFDETDEDMGDYTDEDRRVFMAQQKAAYDWLGEPMPE